MRSLFITISSVLMVASCSDPTGKSNDSASSSNDPHRVEALENTKAITMDDLKSSQMIVIYYGEDCKKSITIKDSFKLNYTKNWIHDHAWPPIDSNSLGAVLPQGCFRVYGSSDSKSEFFTVPVYGSKSRSESDDVHVDSQSWGELLLVITE